MSTANPPRENLVRALRPAVEVRADGEGGMPTLAGHFAVFNTWAEINSAWEGNFLERMAPGAFTKTFKENSRIRALFQHGQDPQVGDKPLGPVEVLREDKVGAYYEVPLLDTSYNRDLLPGLEAGLYGASFRFRVVREELNAKPAPSAYNPHGLPERTVTEAQVMEFGPVTFPAYGDATAGVRSMTDEFIVARLARDPLLLERIGAAIAAAPAEAREDEAETPVEAPVKTPAEAPADESVEQPAEEAPEAPDTETQDDPTDATPEVPEAAPEDVEQDNEHDPAPDTDATALSTPDADRSVTSGTSAAPEDWVRGTQKQHKRKDWLS